MSTVSNEVIKWLTVQVADLTERGPITRFELFHTVEGEQAERLQIFGIESEGTDVQDLGQSVWDCSENDASSRAAGMPQRYVIYAFRGENQDPEGQHAFLIRGRGVSNVMMGMGDSSDAPTERGLQAQLMRYNEGLHRQMMVMTNEVGGRLAQELEKERKRREEVEDKMLEVYKLQQQLLDQAAARDLAAAREASQARRHDEMMGFFMSMAPLVTAKLFGDGPMTGAQTSMRDQAIGKILKNLSAEETQAIMTSLKGTNQIAFIELYKTYAEEDAKNQGEKPIPFRDPKAGGGKK